MAHRALENDPRRTLFSLFGADFSGGPESDSGQQKSARLGDMSGGFTPDNRPGSALKRASESRWHRLIAYISGDPTDVIAPERNELYRSLGELEDTVSTIIPIVDDMFPKVPHAQPPYRRTR